MGVFWGKIGEGVVRYWPLTNSFFLLGVLTSVPILVKIDQEMRPWECSQTDGQTDKQTHWQTQTDFIICPMLYAIAMGQILKMLICETTWNWKLESIETDRQAIKCSRRTPLGEQSVTAIDHSPQIERTVLNICFFLCIHAFCRILIL